MLRTGFFRLGFVGIAVGSIIAVALVLTAIGWLTILPLEDYHFREYRDGNWVQLPRAEWPVRVKLFFETLGGALASLVIGVVWFLIVWTVGWIIRGFAGAE